MRRSIRSSISQVTGRWKRANHSTQLRHRLRLPLTASDGRLLARTMSVAAPTASSLRHPTSVCCLHFFNDLLIIVLYCIVLSLLISHHSDWSVITDHELTPVRRDD